VSARLAKRSPPLHASSDSTEVVLRPIKTDAAAKPMLEPLSPADDGSRPAVAGSSHADAEG
jgi:hypothetical protein